MRKPDGGRVKWGVWGFIVGTIVTMIIGFNWGGWVTGGTADRVATERVEKAVTAARTPFCLERAKAPAESKKLAAFMALKDSGSYEQRDFVADKDKGGWANFGGSEPDRNVAEACATALLKSAGKQATGK